MKPRTAPQETYLPENDPMSPMMEHLKHPSTKAPSGWDDINAAWSFVQQGVVTLEQGVVETVKAHPKITAIGSIAVGATVVFRGKIAPTLEFLGQKGAEAQNHLAQISTSIHELTQPGLHNLEQPAWLAVLGIASVWALGKNAWNQYVQVRAETGKAASDAPASQAKAPSESPAKTPAKPQARAQATASTQARHPQLAYQPAATRAQARRPAHPTPRP